MRVARRRRPRCARRTGVLARTANAGSERKSGDSAWRDSIRAAFAVTVRRAHGHYPRRTRSSRRTRRRFLIHENNKTFVDPRDLRVIVSEAAGTSRRVSVCRSSAFADRYGEIRRSTDHRPPRSPHRWWRGAPAAAGCRINRLERLAPAAPEHVLLRHELDTAGIAASRRPSRRTRRTGRATCRASPCRWPGTPRRCRSPAS